MNGTAEFDGAMNMQPTTFHHLCGLYVVNSTRVIACPDVHGLVQALAMAQRRRPEEEGVASDGPPKRNVVPVCHSGRTGRIFP